MNQLPFVIGFSFVFRLLCAYVDGAVLKNDLFRLDIVHYNDFHAR